MPDTDPIRPAPDRPVQDDPADAGTDSTAGPAPGPRNGSAAPVPGPPPSARPGPPPARPGPPPAAGVPRPRPVAPPAAQPSPVPASSPDPSRWGRADDDGTIHLITPDGDRVIGSFHAGTPQEGLAHFARRFDDLVTETEVLAARIEAGGDAKAGLTGIRTLLDGLGAASVIGDVAALRSRLEDLVGRAETGVAAATADRDRARADALARKEALAVEAEKMAEDSTQWKEAGDRYKSILDEWRTIKGVDRKTDEALWKRFSKARESFNRRRGSHFADLDRQRTVAKERKEELAALAESLAESDDWAATATRYRDLMAEWKATGRAHRDTDDALWSRFRGAQDRFFARRNESFAARDAEFSANAEAKRSLLTEAEKIDLSDPDSARAALRGVQARWEEIGKVPREDVRTLEGRLRSVEEKVSDAADKQWRRTDPEAQARLDQFRSKVGQFEAQAEKARAAGNAKREAEAQRQADQWREWLTAAEQSVEQR